MIGNIDPCRVRVSAWAPVIYSGHDNLTVARFVQQVSDGVPESVLDFSTVTRVVLSFPDLNPPLLFDSAEVSGVLDWSQGDGQIQFDLSTYALAEGIYRAEMVVYDPDHPRGQVLIGSDAPKLGLTLRVDQVNAAGTVPAPLSDDSWITSRTAGESISALRVVYELNGLVYRLDPSTNNVQALLGLTITAADPNATIKVQRTGTVDNDTWAWDVGLVFLTGDGQLTQVPPTTGWEVVVGHAPSARRLNLTFEEPVLLA